MKITCTKCQEEKVQSDFFFRRARGTYYKHCKRCHAGLGSAWKKANPEVAREMTRRAKAKASPESKRRWRQTDYERHGAEISAQKSEYRKRRRASDPVYAERMRLKSARHRAKNIEAHRAMCRDWHRRNPAASVALKSKRRAAFLNAIPPWADLDVIKDVYAEARYFGLHVDHIVPLQSKKVCGLHVWENLQLLDPFTNLAKGNRHWPDMP